MQCLATANNDVHSFRDLQRGTDKLGILLSAERFGTLNGGTECAVDDELRKNTERARNTEENSVVVSLGETVVLEENTRVLGARVSIAAWTVGNAKSLQHRRWARGSWSFRAQ